MSGTGVSHHWADAEWDGRCGAVKAMRMREQWPRGRGDSVYVSENVAMQERQTCSPNNSLKRTRHATVAPLSSMALGRLFNRMRTSSWFCCVHESECVVFAHQAGGDSPAVYFC